MSLFDDLKKAALALDPQFQVSSNEVQGFVSALGHYAAHGPKFLEAAEKGVEDLAQLLEPKPAGQDEKGAGGDGGAPEPAAADAPPPAAAPSESTAPAPVSDAPAAARELTDEELAATIADLQALQASRSATAQQTQVTHETDVPPAPSATWSTS